MCGICGIFDLSGSGRLKNGAALAEMMLEKLSHRGPDGAGIYVSPDANCVLGNKRLAITAANIVKQPASDDASNIWISLDGSIYHIIATID